MKKYTIIYSLKYPISSVVCCDRVETDNISELLDTEKYCGSVWYVFDGWVVDTEDED